MFFVSYSIGGVEVDDDVGSTWRGEVEEISSKEFDRLAPTGDRSNTDCCCERSSAYVIVLLGCELRNTERVSARESERARERERERESVDCGASEQERESERVDKTFLRICCFLEILPF